MEAYFDRLLASDLPIPVCGAAIVWLILTAVSTGLLWKTLRYRGDHFPVEIDPKGEARLSVKISISQILFAAAVFAFAEWTGGMMSAFFAGAWVIMAAVSVALNLRAWSASRRLTQPGLLTGTVKLSARGALLERSADQAATALVCLAIGLLLPHAAPLGAALYLGAASIGLRRKARVVDGQSVVVD